MPNNIVKTFAEKTGKGFQEVEKLWDKAKKIVEKEYPDVEKNSEKFYQIVTGVLKNMLGIEEDVAVTTTADVSNFKVPLGSTYKEIERIYRKKKKQEGTLIEQLCMILEETDAK